MVCVKRGIFVLLALQVQLKIHVPLVSLVRQLVLLIHCAVVCAPRVAIALGLPPILLIALWGHTIRILEPLSLHLA